MSGGRRATALLFVLAFAMFAGISARETALAGTPETLITVNDGAHSGVDQCSSGGHCNIYQAFAYANTVARPHIVFDRPSIGLNIFLDSQLPYLDVKPAGLTIDAGAGLQSYALPIFGNAGINFGVVFISDGDIQNVTMKNMYLESFGYDAVQFCPDYPDTACGGNIHDVVIENVSTYSGGHDGMFLYSNDIQNVQIGDVVGGMSVNDGIELSSLTPNAGIIKNVSINGFYDTGNTQDNLGISAATIDGLTIDGAITYNATNGIHIFGQTIKNVDISGISSFRDTVSYLVNIETSGLQSGTIQEVTIADSDLEMDDDEFTRGIRIAGGAISGVNIKDVVMSRPLAEGLSMVGNSISNVVVDNMSGVAKGSALSINPIATADSIAVKNSEVSAVDGTAIFVGGVAANVPHLSNIEASNNTIEDTGGMGIGVSAGQLNGLLVQGNTVHGGGGALGAIHVGLAGVGSADNIVLDNLVSETSGPAIALSGASGTVTVRGNRTFDNAGLGLDIAPSGVNANDAGDGDNGFNTLLNFPELTSADAQSVTGSACASCTVELFLADGDPSDHGEGKQLLTNDSAAADGSFTFFLCSFALLAGTELTATATDAAGNTSEFSLNFALPQAIDCAGPSETPGPTATPPPGEHKQGDLDCDGDVDADDTIAALLFSADLSIAASGTECPPVGSGSPKYGDVNCDDAVDALDALAILQFAADATIDPPQPGGCTPLGDTL